MVIRGEAAGNVARRADEIDEVKVLNAYEILKIPPTASRDEIRAAYRTLARRWHPDRFMAGPERDWANEKMADINAAYRMCLDGLRDARRGEPDDTEALAHVQRLIDDGEFTRARRQLMGMNTRCAEWNYLFGALLLRTSELDKALIYLSVAAHQAPDSAKYALALREAQRLTATGRLSKLLSRRR